MKKTVLCSIMILGGLVLSSCGAKSLTLAEAKAFLHATEGKELTASSFRITSEQKYNGDDGKVNAKMLLEADYAEPYYVYAEAPDIDDDTLVVTYTKTLLTKVGDNYVLSSQEGDADVQSGVLTEEQLNYFLGIYAAVLATQRVSPDEFDELTEDTLPETMKFEELSGNRLQVSETVTEEIEDETFTNKSIVIIDENGYLVYQLQDLRLGNQSDVREQKLAFDVKISKKASL